MATRMPSSRELAFGHRFGGVVGALGVNVGLKIAEKRIYVELVKNHDVIHGAESGDQRRAGAFGENGAAFAFEFARARIGIDAHYEDIAFAPRSLQIAHVSNVQQIEDAIGENDFAAGAAVLFEDRVQSFAGNNFFAGVHAC